MILTTADINEAWSSVHKGAATPTLSDLCNFARLVERATLEKAARRFDAGDKSALWPEEVRDLLLFWANQDADGRLRETQRAGL